MKVSLLLLAGLSVALLLHAFHKSQASELSRLLDKEIQELKDEIEKRGGKRKPCGFSWFCRRKKRKGKRSGLSKDSAFLNFFGSDDFDDIMDAVDNEE